MSSSSQKRQKFKEQKSLGGFATEHVASVDETVSLEQAPLVRPQTLQLELDMPEARITIPEDHKKVVEAEVVVPPSIQVGRIDVSTVEEAYNLFFNDTKAEDLLADSGAYLKTKFAIPTIVMPDALPTIQICDENGVIASEESDAELPDSPAPWTKKKAHYPATAKRKTSMKRQYGIDAEKKPLDGYMKRRITRRLVNKESEDATQPSTSDSSSLEYIISIPVPPKPSPTKVVSKPFAAPIDLDSKVSYTPRGPQEIRVEPAAIPSAPASLKSGSLPTPSKSLKSFIPSIGPRKRSKKDLFVGRIRSVGKAVVSSLRSLFGFVEVHEALVVNRKRQRVYAHGGALYPTDYTADTTETQEPEETELAYLCDDEVIDFRPFFTYWITTLQALILTLSLILYGIGPIAFSRVENTKMVSHVSGSFRLMTVFELPNLWIGPSYPHLIHMGAKYAPCMRRDSKVYRQIEGERNQERNTGCCVMNDRSACFQTTRDSGECIKNYAKFTRWNDTHKGPQERTSGAVCGQDPRTCEDPPAGHLWPDDITKWPVCYANNKNASEGLSHMTCPVEGRPCCIQLHGQCRITTQEYCRFVNGHFHAEARLCSQVNCLGDVCGMSPFIGGIPNQFYRFLTPMLLHAGLVGLVVTIFLQLSFMVTLEKMIGWRKIAVIYLVSGFGGYLASAVFVPYMPEVGPSGSQGGLLGALLVDGYYHWDLTTHKWRQMKNLFLAVFGFLFIGFLPWVDNYAQWFGFVYGILLAILLVPPVGDLVDLNDPQPWKRRLGRIITSVVILFVLTVTLLVIFFSEIIEIPPIFQYFNCIPLIDHTCDNKGLQLKNWIPI
ncbi:hypothetical protein L596_028220 [Steinernema carpocapsae]|nr:hypothetical protein L596_028220 [Steinernema carpocapsae]